MTQNPAPPNILQMIFCGCTSGCGLKCGYRKQGLSCSLACKVCMGRDCTNAQNVISTEILTEIAMEKDDNVHEGEDDDNDNENDDDEYGDNDEDDNMF